MPVMLSVYAHQINVSAGRISSLEDEVRKGKDFLTRVESEKRHLQERLAALEKVRMRQILKGLSQLDNIL